MAAVHNVVFVFGGISSDGNVDGVGFDAVLVPSQLWRWTNATNQWMRVLSQGPSQPVGGVGMAVVSTPSLFALFGGVGSGAASNHVWLYKAGTGCGQGCTVNGQCDEEHKKCVCDIWWHSSCTVQHNTTTTISSTPRDSEADDTDKEVTVVASTDDSDTSSSSSSAPASASGAGASDSSDGGGSGPGLGNGDRSAGVDADLRSVGSDVQSRNSAGVPGLAAVVFVCVLGLVASHS